MRVPEAVLRCVAFIGEVSHRDSSGVVHGDLHATGFFVKVESKLFPGLMFAYIVTAKHVAEDLKDREIYILVNNRYGGTTHLHTIGPRWWFHPADPTADIAIRQVAEHPDVDTFAIASTDFITPAAIRVGEAAIGDEVFITGLFTPAPGHRRNLPIVRLGNIAMLPEEQIQTELGFADVYLVEGRSIGGISGSPVFARRTITLQVPLSDSSVTTFNGAGPFKLLGAMHGHWDIKESEINRPLIEHDRRHGVNLGIGIVVPAQKILETINQPELVELRRLGEQDLVREKEGSAPGVDSAGEDAGKPPTDSSITKQDFEDALKNASRKLPEK